MHRSLKDNARLIASCALFATSAVLTAGFAGEAQAADKRGPLMFNLKIGPAIQLVDMPTQFALELEGAYALDHARNFYLAVPLQFQFERNTTTINLPLGIQYDIEIPGVKGLFLYPKLNAGVSIIVANRGGGNAQAAFALQPEFGIKYQVTDLFHIGCEPISLPMYIGNPNDAFLMQYRLFFYGGLDI